MLETMTAPTPASPAQTPAPPPSSPASPAASPGFFDHQAFAEPRTAAPEPAPAATPTETKAAAVEPSVAKVYAGRFKTPEELEIAYGESSSEGLRLYQESIALKSQLSQAEVKLAEAIEASKLGQAMPFRELTKEQFEKLESESPVKAAEYLFEKKLHDRDVADAQKNGKAQREALEAKNRDTQNYILERGKDLSSSPEKYPHYNELVGDMEFVSKKLGNDLVGKGWAPDFLYLVALGRMYHASLLKGAKAGKESLETVKVGAASVAAATAPGGASPSEVPGKEDPNSDKAFMERILKAGNQQYFKG